MIYIAYIRVSTHHQDSSGLGLSAQRTAVQNFISNNDTILTEYKEVESGKNDQRPQLLRAIEHCKSSKATLLVAKLDRLSRNASFIFTLRNTQVQFTCVDMPEANSLTIGIMAVLAQDERERISQRTKVALAELKKKGVKLGNPQNLTDQARQKSIKVRREKALSNPENRKAIAISRLLRNQGKSYRYIASELNRNGFLTSRNNTFYPATVFQLLKYKEVI